MRTAAEQATAQLETSLTSAEDDWGPLSDLPGHPMMWVLILCETATFGLMLLGFVVARLVQPAVFAAGQAALDSLAAGVETLILLTSGLLAAEAVQFREKGVRAAARHCLLAAMVLGAGFVGLKLTEYLVAVAAGIGLETSTFFMLYFLLTGFHLLHVVMGMVVLGVAAWHDTPENLRTGTAFWHMVDLVWIVMYALVYLVR